MTAVSSSPGRCRGGCRLGACDQRFERERAGARARHREPVFELGQLAGRRQAVRERGLVDQDPGAALRQHVAQARRLLADAKRHGDRPEPLHREQRDQKFRPVAEQERDPVAGDDAE